MEVLVYSTRPYDRDYLEEANKERHRLHFTEARLDEATAVLAHGFPAVCCFIDDNLDAGVLRKLSQGGTRLVALRAMGFNNVDLETAESLGMTSMRVRDYSPYSVAEFAVALILALDRKIHRAYNRVREQNFLLDGLIGFDVHGKTVGIIGTGRIGTALAHIMHGFGCPLLGYDIIENPGCISLGMQYVSLEKLLAGSDIISIHAPLTPQTHHMINARTLSFVKQGSMLINTSRGALVDTPSLVAALEERKLGCVGLDVYEEESYIYFKDLSNEIIPDEVITRLISFPNVIITGHQGFFTREALATIAMTTIGNISDFAAGRTNENVIKPRQVIAPA